ncbi:Fe-S cluster assembly protein IscX [Candidatus Cyrtobacter comes]|uniref:Fe-S cluster assembly protein IscX n=1 Tax=Candidatus Cyrtobacter comes TaxID=675776 RepID=A0ABU5L844_9RICK|nr:Fe-S cluster assembly protein IscX [Candidatus Cyrtobacter comes]MDZ5762291.1 Fe-S cluster assembly protein IscX [Candidatus Cyrtobacter comes]
MRWIDIEDIVLCLEDEYPTIDINSITFPKLMMMIESLPGFSPEDTKCNEKILEAVQSAWLEERE